MQVKYLPFIQIRADQFRLTLALLIKSSMMWSECYAKRLVTILHKIIEMFGHVCYHLD